MPKGVYTRPPKRLCSLPGCSRPAYCIGVCRAHDYKRRIGSPNWRKPIFSRSLERKGWVHRGYRYVMVQGEEVLEHRYVVEQHLGRKLDTDEVVHHINGIKGDNALSNLRVMSRAEHQKLHRGVA